MSEGESTTGLPAPENGGTLPQDVSCATAQCRVVVDGRGGYSIGRRPAGT
jgi:hypothetical protein